MKFKQPKTYAPPLALLGGAIVGAMASRVGYSMLPETKESSTETLYKGAIVAVTGAGATFVDGNDTISNFVRGALIGASAEQTLSLVKQMAQDSKVESKLVKQAVGLACPCQEKTLGNPFANLQRGRIIPLITRSTGDFNPYQNTTHSNPNEEIDRELGLDEARERQEALDRAVKALSRTTTI